MEGHSAIVRLLVLVCLCSVAIGIGGKKATGKTQSAENEVVKPEVLAEADANDADVMDVADASDADVMDVADVDDADVMDESDAESMGDLDKISHGKGLRKDLDNKNYPPNPSDVRETASTFSDPYIPDPAIDPRLEPPNMYTDAAGNEVGEPQIYQGYVNFRVGDAPAVAQDAGRDGAHDFPHAPGEDPIGGNEDSEYEDYNRYDPTEPTTTDHVQPAGQVSEEESQDPLGFIVTAAALGVGLVVLVISTVVLTRRKPETDDLGVPLAKPGNYTSTLNHTPVTPSPTSQGEGQARM